MVQLHPLGHYVPVYLRSSWNRDLPVNVLIYCLCVCVCSRESKSRSLNTSQSRLDLERGVNTTPIFYECLHERECSHGVLIMFQTKEVHSTWRKPTISILIHLNGSFSEWNKNTHSPTKITRDYPGVWCERQQCKAEYNNNDNSKVWC